MSEAVERECCCTSLARTRGCQRGACDEGGNLMHRDMVMARRRGGLAGLCDQHRQEGAEQWASLEGWDAHSVTAEQAGAMFMKIADLAKRATETGRGMYLWQCEYP
jgi:hypothetical protein